MDLVDPATAGQIIYREIVRMNDYQTSSVTDFTSFTVNSGYQVHVPIALSGKKYVLNKMYVLNKQVSKYGVMALFSNNTSILSCFIISHTEYFLNLTIT